RQWQARMDPSRPVKPVAGPAIEGEVEDRPEPRPLPLWAPWVEATQSLSLHPDLEGWKRSHMPNPLLEKLDRGLIVSCQPVPQGPMDNVECVIGFSLAAVAAGACGLRIESLAYVEAVRAVTDVPIIGIIKHDL